MTDHRVTLRLNQQQLELVDNTVAKGGAPNRTALIRRALKEFAAAHRPDEKGARGQPR